MTPKCYLPKGTHLPMWRAPPRIRPQFDRLDEKFQALLRDPVAFAQLFCSWEGEDVRLDAWQRAFLRRRQRFRAFEKSVQIGFSWIAAFESFHRGFVYEADEASFISVSENEAKNKIRYVSKFLDGLAPWLRALVAVTEHSKEAIAFGREGNPSSIIRSLPAAASLRGRATHVYIDEIDHFRPGLDREIFTASIGRVTRDYRRLTIGSSVFGEESVLAGIMRAGIPGEPSQYPDFLKARLPWWVSENESTLETINLAQRNMPEEDFQQEYECQRTIILDSLFPQDFIRQHFHDRRPIALNDLDEKAAYLAGYDPGGAQHPAVLTVFAQAGGQWNQCVLERWRGKSLTEQQYTLQRLLTRCAGLTLAIDPGGPGKQMSDFLEDEYGARVGLVKFTQQAKHDLAINLRRVLERSEARLIRDSDLAHQMNRTRRRAAGKIDQPQTSKKSHYDEFWATALALHQVGGEHMSVYDSRGLLLIDTEAGELVEQEFVA